MSLLQQFTANNRLMLAGVGLGHAPSPMPKAMHVVFASSVTDTDTNSVAVKKCYCSVRLVRSRLDDWIYRSGLGLI